MSIFYTFLASSNCNWKWVQCFLIHQPAMYFHYTSNIYMLLVDKLCCIFFQSCILLCQYISFSIINHWHQFPHDFTCRCCTALVWAGVLMGALSSAVTLMVPSGFGQLGVTREVFSVLTFFFGNFMVDWFWSFVSFD